MSDDELEDAAWLRMIGDDGRRYTLEEVEAELRLPQREDVARTSLYLWDGEGDITAQFVLDEQDDGTHVSGPIERLTAYSVNPDKTLGVNIGPEERDMARRAMDRGDLFMLVVPHHYVRWS